MQMSGPDAMTSQEQELLTRVARAMQASKAWPAVFDAGSAEVLARAAIEAITPVVEQAFKDGMVYGNNVKDADPELAWQQSRVRASLSKT